MNDGYIYTCDKDDDSMILIFKLIELFTLNIYSFFYVNGTSIDKF
jgi:hypothetical protein